MYYMDADNAYREKARQELHKNVTNSIEHASVEQPRRTYLQQLYMYTGYRLENLPGVMDDRDDLQERGSGKSMPAV